MLSVISIGVRAFALLFGAVVLGLSVTLAKQQVSGSPPSETSFSSFAGAFGIIVSTIGLVAIWVDKIPALFVLAADALASVFYLAGGIALVLALRGVGGCSANDDESVRHRMENKILNGGCLNGNTWCNMDGRQAVADLTAGHCTRAQADYVFEFLAFIFGLGLIVLGWMSHKRGRTSTRSYA